MFLAFSVLAKAWDVQSQITHTGIGASTGSISLQGIPVTDTFYYHWSTNDTSAAISGLATGNYQCTITRGSDSLVRAFQIGYITTWDTLVKTLSPSNGCVYTGSNVSYSFDGYAYGLNALRPSDTGWCEFTIAPGDTFQGILAIANNLRLDNTTQAVGIGIVGSMIFIIGGEEDGVYIGDFVEGNGYRFVVSFTTDSMFVTKYETDSTSISVSTAGIPFGRTENLSILVFPFTMESKVAQTASSFDCSVMRLSFTVEPGGKEDTTTTIYSHVKGGTPPYSYSWNNSGSNASIQDVEAGVYAVTVTDDNSVTIAGSCFGGFFVAWDNLLQVTEDSNYSLYASGSVINDFVTGLAFSKNLSKSGEDGHVLFEWEKGGDFTGVVGLINTIDFTKEVVGILVAVLPDENAEPGMLSPQRGIYVLGDEFMYIGHVWDSLPLNLRIERAGDSVYLYKNDVSIASGFYREGFPFLYPVVAMGDGNRTNRVTTDFRIGLKVRLSIDSCYTDSTGQQAMLRAECEGGLAPYTYYWSTGDTLSSIVTSFDSLLTVLVVDANGDSVTKQMLPVSLLANLEEASVEACEGTDITVTVNGGDYYLWSTGDSTNSISYPFATDTSLSVIVSGANGCSSTLYAEVNVHPVLIAVAGTLVAADTTCINGGTPVRLSGYTGDRIIWEESNSEYPDWYTYDWTTPMQTEVWAYSDHFITREFRAIVQNGLCAADTSNTVSVAIALDLNPLIPVLVPGPNSVDGNESIDISVEPDAYITDWWMHYCGWQDGMLGTGMGWYTDILTFFPIESTSDIYVRNAAMCVDSTLQFSPCVKKTIYYHPVDIEITNCLVDTLGILAEVTVTADFGTPPYTFEWSQGDTANVVLLQLDSLYSVTVTNGYNDTILRKIRPRDILASISPAYVAVCPGIAADITTTSGDSFLWSTGDTTASIAYIATSDTTVSVEVTQFGVCTTTLYTIVDVQDTLPVNAGTLTAEDTVCRFGYGELRLEGITGDNVVWQSKDMYFGDWYNEWSPSNLDTVHFAMVYNFNTIYRAFVNNGVCSSDTSNIVNFGVVQDFSPYFSPTIYSSIDTLNCPDEVLFWVDSTDGFAVRWYKDITVASGISMMAHVSNENPISIPIDYTTRIYARKAAFCDEVEQLSPIGSKDMVVLNGVAPIEKMYSQKICSDTVHTFVWDSVVAGIGGDQIEWSWVDDFDTSVIVASGSDIEWPVENGHNDTLWVRSRNSVSGCVSSSSTVYAHCLQLPSPPLAPTLLTTCTGDTLYTFVIDTVVPGVWGNKIQWSWTSNFGSYYVIDSGMNMFWDVATGDTDTVWLRSLISSTGCVSESVSCFVTVNQVPHTPFAPVPQVFCADTIHTFILDTILPGLWGDQIAWSVYNNFDSSVVQNTFATISKTVGAGVTDTIWLRSNNSETGCSSEGLAVILQNKNYPASPIAPQNQYTCSDTGFTFLFTDIQVEECGAYILDCSTDSTFSDYLSFAPFGSFSLFVPTDSSITVWIRSRGVDTTTVGGIVSTVATVYSLPELLSVVVSDTMVCRGDTAFVAIANTETDAYYLLFAENGLIYSMLGNGDTLELFFPVDSTTNFVLIGQDTLTGCQVTIKDTFTISVPDLLTAPVFVSFDTTICVGATSCYTTNLDSTSQVYFSIVNGFATVDSSLGCVTNVISSFTIRALVYNQFNCDSAYTDLHVYVDTLLPLVMPEPLVTCYDTGQLFSYDSIVALDCGTDVIEVSLDSSFASATTYIIPAGLDFWIDVDSTLNVWIRGKDTITGQTSIPQTHVLTASSYLSPPIAPDSQVVCCGSSHTFVFDSIFAYGCGADAIEFSFDSTFSVSDTSLIPASIEFYLDTNEVRQVWMRTLDTTSGKKSIAVFTIASTYSYPLPPKELVDKMVCSNSSETITFPSVTSGLGGDRIEWSTDSNFTPSTIQYSGTDISILIAAGEDSTIWLRSRDSRSGRVSSSVTTNAAVKNLPTGSIYPVDTTLAGWYDSVTLIAVVDTSYFFAWMGQYTSQDTIVAQPFGDTTSYSILIVDTVTGCSNTATSTVYKTDDIPEGESGNQVSYVSLINSSTVNRSINTSRSVGIIPGTHGVSSSGAGTYNIPISVPPGTNELVPTISLAYSSQAGNGLLGWGWELAGLSNISRAVKNMYHDNMVSPPQFTEQDAFALDGQRLIQLNTGQQNGYDGTTYATELDAFSVITSHGTFNSFSGNPEWFSVFTKDGMTMEFGNSADSRMLNKDGTHVLLWKLSKISDNYGNYAEFKYKTLSPQFMLNDAQVVVDEINYTGNAIHGLAPYNKIKFTYGQRKDANKSYLGGKGYNEDYLVTNIVITGEGGAIYKIYELSYGYDGLYSLLSEITETGSDGSKLNSTIFKYYNAPTAFSTVNLGNLIWTDKEVFCGDYNGDGFSDMLQSQIAYNSQGNFAHYSNYQFSRNSGNVNSFVSAASGNLSVNYTEIDQYTKVPDFYGFSVSDFNGDGSDDFLTIRKHISSGSQNWMILDGIEINYVTNNCGLVTTSTFPPPYTDPVLHPSGKSVYQGDFDGDGRTDYFIPVSGSVGNASYKAYITYPSKNIVNEELFFILPYPEYNPLHAAAALANADRVLILDFDGDGKSDVMTISGFVTRVFSINPSNYQATIIYQSGNNQSAGYPTKWHDVYLGDFNGDRKTDILTRVKRSSGDVWEVALSTGKSFAQASRIFFYKQPSISNNPFDDKLVIADFNGDGKSDVFHGYDNPQQAHTSIIDVYYSNGIDFSFSQFNYNQEFSNFSLIIGDFTGDGKADILHRRFLPDAKTDLLMFQNAGKERLIEKIVNGFNHTIDFDFERLTSGSGFYSITGSSTYPVNTIRPAALAISTQKVPDGLGGTNTLSFKYSDMYFHRSGRGIMGFKKMTCINSVGIVSESEYEFSSTYYSSVLKSSLNKLLNGAHLSAVHNANSFIALGNSGKRYYVRTDYSTALDNLTQSVKTVSNTFDAYGNIVLSITDNNGVELVTETSTFSSNGSPYPTASKPSSVNTTTTRTGAPPFSQTTVKTYNSQGDVLAGTDFSGTGCAQSQSFVYNGFGNVLSQSISTASVPARNIYFTYDSKGRFITQKENQLGQTESFVYNPLFGKPISHTASDNLTTSYTYDGYGRQTSKTFPQGFSVYTSYDWDIQSGANATIYYKYVTSPGKPDLKTWFDMFGREVRIKTEGFKGEWLTEEIAYDERGNVASRTKPYYSSETPYNISYTYDSYNRLIVVDEPIGSSGYAYSYNSSGNTTVTFTNFSGQTSSKTTDVTGKVTKSTDPGGILTFTYDSYGNNTKVQQGNTILIQNEFDPCGHQSKMTDIDAGITQYTYNGFGELTSQINANGKDYQMTYDVLGRITSKDGPEGTTTYQYYPSGFNGINKLRKIIGFGQNPIVQEFSYDLYSQLTTFSEKINNQTLITNYDYDQYGNEVSTGYSSGFGVIKEYDANGYLTEIRNAADNSMIYEVGSMNGYGQCRTYSSGNGKSSTITYDYHYPKRFYTPGIQDLELDIDFESGNILSRTDNLNNNITDFFTYDNLERLVSSHTSGHSAVTYSYSANGNITSKPDAGSYTYYAGKIHAVKRVTNPQQLIDVNTPQNITYTSFDQPQVITEGTAKLEFTYGHDYQRRLVTFKNNNSVVLSRYYSGNYEMQIANLFGTSTQHIHYIHGVNGLVAIAVRENGNDNIYYTYTDHLGSVLTVTDASAGVVAEQSFDAWGRKRNHADWTYSNLSATPLWLYRGYTGHEHLPTINLINMNGRLYDPLLGRMLSPDNYVQLPYSTQSYNRYSYCLNNPLKYSDPTGEIAWFAPILIGAAVGAAIGGTINVLSYINSPGPKNVATGFKAFFIGAGVGAITGITAASLTIGVPLGMLPVAMAGAAFVTSTMSMPVLNELNHRTFGVPYMTPQDYALGVAINTWAAFGMGVITVGAVNSLPQPRPSQTPVDNVRRFESDKISSTTQSTDDIAIMNDNRYSLVFRNNSTNTNATAGDRISFDLNQRPVISGYRDGLKTDLYHNFPKEFDQSIVNNGGWAQRISDYKNYGNYGSWFEAPGYINDVYGHYQIGINEAGIVFHRNFVPYKY